MKCHISRSLKPKVDARGRDVMVQNVNAEPNSLPILSKHFHHEPEKDEKSLEYRGVRAGWAGWAHAHPFFCLTFNEKGHLLSYYLLPVE